MRTSLNEIAQIESWVTGRLQPSEKLLFEARLLVSPALRDQLKLQQAIHQVVRLFARKQLKQELRAVQNNMFRQAGKSAFQQEVNQIFKKH